MTAKDFLFSELEKISSIFSELTIKYELREDKKLNLVNITPSTIYNNDIFLNYIYKIEDYFIENLKSDEIIFINENSLNSINNITKEWKPKYKFIDLMATKQSNTYIDIDNNFGIENNLKKLSSELIFGEYIEKLNSNHNFSYQTNILIEDNINFELDRAA